MINHTEYTYFRLDKIPYGDKSLKISGIYFIKNILTSKLYIGSSKNIRDRVGEHKSLMISNSHYNKKLQYNFNKYGIENFIIGMVEIVEGGRNERIKREQYWINTFFQEKADFRKHSLNIKYNADGGIANKRNSNSQKRKISVFDLNMNFLEEVESVNATQRKYNCKITDCCKGKCSRVRNFIFRYSDELEVKYIDKRKLGTPHKDTKKVYQYSLDGVFLREWRSCKDASLGLNLSETNILSSLKNKTRRAGDFIFSYEKKVSLNKVYKNKFQYKLIESTTNQELVFETARELVKFAGIKTESTIHYYINQKSLFQGKWKITREPVC